MAGRVVEKEDSRMRTFGLVLLVAGVVGFFYCSSQLEKAEPLPAEISISKSLDYPAGRFEVGRYASVAAGFCGVILLMFPQGR
jgi:hypothetical protein